MMLVCTSSTERRTHQAGQRYIHSTLASFPLGRPTSLARPDANMRFQCSVRASLQRNALSFWPRDAFQPQLLSPIRACLSRQTSRALPVKGVHPPRASGYRSSPRCTAAIMASHRFLLSRDCVQCTSTPTCNCAADQDCILTAR